MVEMSSGRLVIGEPCHQASYHIYLATCLVSSLISCMTHGCLQYCLDVGVVYGCWGQGSALGITMRVVTKFGVLCRGKS